METKLFLGGFGGQGVVFGGKMMGAAAADSGKKATAYSEYAPAMRNAYTYTTLIVSDEMVGAPVTDTFDYMVFFDEASCALQSGKLDPEGKAYLVNTSLVTSAPAVKGKPVYGLPATEMADKMGDLRKVNIIMIGAILKVTGVLSLDAMEEQIRKSLGKKPEVAASNLEALYAGYEAVQLLQ